MSAKVEGSEVKFAGRHVRVGKGHLWTRGGMGWGPGDQRSRCVKGELNPLFLRGLGKWWARCAAIRDPGPQKHGRGASVKGRGALSGHLSGRTRRAVGSESAGVQAGGKWSESVPISSHPLRAPSSLCSTHLGAPERSCWWHDVANPQPQTGPAVSSEPAAATEVGFSVLSGLGRGLDVISGSEHHVYTILTLALCSSLKSGGDPPLGAGEWPLSAHSALFAQCPSRKHGMTATDVRRQIIFIQVHRSVQ